MDTQITKTQKAAFHGLGRLFGDNTQEVLLKAHVCVVGIGGVGSWTAEALARSGVGTITLIDMDDICVTNINRQLHAIQSSVGQPKVEVMRERILAINPEAEVNAVFDFFTRDNHLELISEEFDYVIDAIDSLSNKVLLVQTCLEKKIPVLTVGGAAGKQDPSKVVIGDLGMSCQDNLLKRLRKKLRQTGLFPEDTNTFHIDAVFSSERAVYPDGKGGTCFKKDAPKDNLKLDCQSGMGTASFVTGTFGFCAAAKAVQRLVNNVH